MQGRAVRLVELERLLASVAELRAPMLEYQVVRSRIAEQLGVGADVEVLPRGKLPRGAYKLRAASSTEPFAYLMMRPAHSKRWPLPAAGIARSHLPARMRRISRHFGGSSDSGFGKGGTSPSES